MSFELILKAEASHDITDAYAWYEQQQAGLGEGFLNEVEKHLNIIKKNPNLYSERYKNKRAAVLGRFPYLIVYELMGQQIVVYAVFNTSQNPRKLKERK